MLRKILFIILCLAAHVSAMDESGATNTGNNIFDSLTAIHNNSLRDLSTTLKAMILDGQTICNTITRNVTLPETNVQSSWQCRTSGDVMQISHDSQYVMQGQWTTPLFIQNLTNHDIVFEQKIGQLSDGSFSPDGTRIATSSKFDDIKIWDIAKQKCISSLTPSRNPNDTPFLFGHDTWSPDCTHIAIFESDQNIKIWNVINDTHFSISSRSAICSPAWHPNCQEIAVNAFDGVHIWNINSNQCVKTIPHHDNQECESIAWSPTHNLLAMTTHQKDTNNHYLRMHDLSSSKDILSVEIDCHRKLGHVLLAGWCYNTPLIALHNQTSIQFWDIITGTCIKIIEFSCNCESNKFRFISSPVAHRFSAISWSNDGRRLHINRYACDTCAQIVDCTNLHETVSYLSNNISMKQALLLLAIEKSSPKKYKLEHTNYEIFKSFPEAIQQSLAPLVTIRPQ